MQFLIETIFIAAAAFLITAILNLFYKKDSPSLPGFPWALWVVVHLVVGALGGSLTVSMQGSIFGGIGNWALLGAFIGIVQWMVLRRYIPVGIFWAVSSTLGWSVFSIIHAAQAPSPLDWFLTGIFVGFLQWLCLTGKARGTAWWILSNGFAWLVGGFLGTYAGLLLLQITQNPIFSMVVGWAITGLIVGLILGIPMVKMKEVPGDRMTGNEKTGLESPHAGEPVL